MKNLALRIATTVMMITLFSCSKDDGPKNDPPPVNQAPVANAGPDQKVEIGSTVNLNGIDSNDSDGNELTYKWTIKSKPTGSIAEISGSTAEQANFDLDKAGNYVVELTVSDGEKEAKDEITVSNKTPIINSIDGFSDFSNFEAGDLVRRGSELEISGAFFSPDVSEMRVTLNGRECELVFRLDGIHATIPEDAQGGSLVLWVGEEKAVHPSKVFITTTPITEFSESELLDEETQAGPTKYEIGCIVKPKKNGKFLGFRTTYGAEMRYTIWDVATGTIIADATGGPSEVRAFTIPLAVQADVEYLITVNTNRHRIYSNSSQSTIFPADIFGEIEVSGYGYHLGEDQLFPNTIVRENYAMPYLADVYFVADIEN